MKIQVAIFLLGTIVASQALSEEQEKTIKQYSKECLSVSNVEESVLKEAEKGNFINDDKLKVHALCFSKKVKMQNEKGEVQVEAVKEKLNAQMKDPAEVDKLIELCLVQKDTPENTAFEDLQCFHKNLPKGVSLI